MYNIHQEKFFFIIAPFETEYNFPLYVCESYVCATHKTGEKEMGEKKINNFLQNNHFSLVFSLKLSCAKNHASS